MGMLILIIQNNTLYNHKEIFQGGRDFLKLKISLWEFSTEEILHGGFSHGRSIPGKSLLRGISCKIWEMIRN